MASQPEDIETECMGAPLVNALNSGQDWRVSFDTNGSIVWPAGFDPQNRNNNIITCWMIIVLNLNETCAELRKGFFFFIENGRSPHGCLFYRASIWCESQLMEWATFKWSQKLAEASLGNGILCPAELVLPISFIPYHWNWVFESPDEPPSTGSMAFSPKADAMLVFWSKPGQYRGRVHLLQRSVLTGPDDQRFEELGPDVAERGRMYKRHHYFGIPGGSEKQKIEFSAGGVASKELTHIWSVLEPCAQQDLHGFVNEVHRILLHEDSTGAFVRTIMDEMYLDDA